MSENNGFHSLTQLTDGLNGPLLFQKKRTSPCFEIGRKDGQMDLWVQLGGKGLRVNF